MIEEILPGGVVAVEARGDLTGDLLEPGEGILPEEAPLVAKAVPSRQREFTTVRICARRALGRLGQPPVALVTNRRGAPQWPAGVVGSMTHCAGYRAAAVARSGVAAAVGIDAEPHQPLPAGVLRTIALPREQRSVGALLDRSPATAWDRILFSAKESVFKAWYPLTGLELAFEEADIEIEEATGTFSARLLRPGPVVGGRRLAVFSGRWLARDGLVMTAVTVEPAAPAR
ncbi:4'-phosphopantetheinyl transferase superfamily protein [Streptomyces sp. NPDC048255]|uniref:4'-phosphopantetheinyl transferase family protein n=1 Tax=Streptomyces TaxID=1883 RepID=UPI003407B678